MPNFVPVSIIMLLMIWMVILMAINMPIMLRATINSGLPTAAPRLSLSMAHFPTAAWLRCLTSDQAAVGP